MTVLFVFCVSLLFVHFFNKKKSSVKKLKRNITTNLIMFGILCVLAVALPLSASAEAAPAAEDVAEAAVNGVNGLGLLAAALATGMSSLGAGIAVGPAAVSAIGAISESPQILSKAIIFVALGEGVAIYGMLISILIINKL